MGKQNVTGARRGKMSSVWQRAKGEEGNSPWEMEVTEPQTRLGGGAEGWHLKHEKVLARLAWGWPWAGTGTFRRRRKLHKQRLPNSLACLGTQESFISLSLYLSMERSRQKDEMGRLGGGEGRMLPDLWSLMCQGEWRLWTLLWRTGCEEPLKGFEQRDNMIRFTF